MATITDEKIDREFTEHVSTKPVEDDITSQSDEWRAASRSVVRELDMTLMPMVWILYVFNYLDRNNIA